MKQAADGSDPSMMKVGAIRDGTVIDHIPPGQALKVLRIMGVDGGEGHVVTVAMNVPSASKGRKDIVKVEGREIRPSEMDRIALLAPGATINIIREFEVAQKYQVQLPDVLEGVIPCENPNCISNQREPVPSRLCVRSREPLILRCAFCERDQHDPHAHL